jgi:hypothetical protein
MQNIFNNDLTKFLKKKAFNLAIIENGYADKSFFTYIHYYKKNKTINIHQDTEFILLKFYKDSELVYKDKYPIYSDFERSLEEIQFDITMFCQDFIQH